MHFHEWVSESHLGCYGYNWSPVQVAVFIIQAERDWILCEVRAGAEDTVFIKQICVLCEVIGENVETFEHRTYVASLQKQMTAFRLMNLTSNFSTKNLTTNESARGVDREYFEDMSHGRLA